MNKFKQGDIVKCINSLSSLRREVSLREHFLYVIESIDGELIKLKYIKHKWHQYRFVKIDNEWDN